MSLITISDVGKDYGAETVLSSVTAAVARAERIGIVGKNGGGKTTLLRLILGIEEPTRGTIRIARGVKIGYLSQIAIFDETRTVRTEAETALSALADAEAHLREAETDLAENPDDPERLDAYGAARDRFDFLGGESAKDNLFGALTAMGFSESDLEKRISVLSGGEKTRLAMAKLLASAPDILALDEPTNHLDIRAVEWLEGFLTRFPGAVLLVSHDRRFLEATIKTVWEVEELRTGDGAGVNVYSGGYAAYREKRAAARARQAEDYERQQADIARIEEFIRRNKAGQNSKIARGREKQLARVERLERPSDDPSQMRANVAAAGRSGLDVVVAERVNKSYGARTIFNNVNFVIRRGDRVGVVGPNGAGKTTLIEMLIGDESPDSGFLRAGHGVSVAMHRQEQSHLLDDADPEESVLEAFLDSAGMTSGAARSHLAKFLFSGEDVFKPVKSLSGGERAKLALALMVLTPANLLILDEPTNHLDVYSCDALSETLLGFDGTLMLISHDRALLDSATSKTLALDGRGGVELFDGPYFAWRADQDAKLAKAQTPTKSAGKGAKPSEIVAAPNAFARSKERQKAQKRLSLVEDEIAKLEGKLGEIEAGLSAPRDSEHAISLAAGYAATQSALDAKLLEWEDVAAALEE